MNDVQVAELAAANGNTKEIGTSGLEVYWGQVEKADNSKLFWPTCYDLFNKFLRRDPQVAQWRVATASMASKVDWYWELPQEDPTPTETAFLKFLHSIWDDLPGGQRKLIDTYIHYILMGWMWFENVPARRNGQRVTGADWASVYDDGLVGFRDIAFRDHSSFSKWEINESTGKLRGFVQRDYPNAEVVIPLARSTHVTLGDPTSPEGLSPFEALWRLESFMYNLEIIYGIGSERSAGYVKFQSERESITATDKSNAKIIARAMMSAQEGNFALLPGGLAADIMDSPFSAGATVLESIKYYGHLKSQVLNMQWMSLSLTGDAGSNASMMTSSGLWLTAFNAQMTGAAKVIGEQLATQLRDYNRSQFGSIKRLPVLKATPVEANIDLLELAQFVTAVFPVLDITAEDLAAVRRKSAFLPEIEIAEIVEDDVDQDKTETEAEEGDTQTGDDESVEGDEAEREFAQIVANAEFMRTLVDGKEVVIPNPEFARPVAIGKNQPTVTTAEDLVDLDDEDDIKRMIRRIERIDPFIAGLLEAEEADEE